MPETVLVADTNIWIDLHRGYLLEVVFSLPYDFVTTDFAWEELHHPSGQSLEQLGLTVTPMPPDDIPVLQQLTQDLNNSSLADVSCLHLARSNQWVLLTGDKAVRNAGQGYQVAVHGVLWLMDQLFSNQLVSGPCLADSLQAMLDANARFPTNECESRLKQWREATH